MAGDAGAGDDGSSAVTSPSRAAPRPSATPTRALACPPVPSSRKLAHLGRVSGLAEAVMMMRGRRLASRCYGAAGGCARALSLAFRGVGKVACSIRAPWALRRDAQGPRPKVGRRVYWPASQCPLGGGGGGNILAPPPPPPPPPFHRFSISLMKYSRTPLK